jgi:tetrathionate reductase subunit B
MPRYVMVVNRKKCIGCMACVVACSTENNVAEGNYRTKVVETVEGTFPHLRMELRPELCNHCEEAPCVSNCPTGASYREKEDGLVKINKKRCVGCKACIAACPYDARFIDPRTGVAEKCTFCEHRIKDGKAPACVATCLGNSRIFGDLDDVNNEVSKILSEKHAEVLLKDAGTKPRVFYV